MKRLRIRCARHAHKDAEVNAVKLKLPRRIMKRLFSIGAQVAVVLPGGGLDSVQLDLEEHTKHQGKGVN